MRLGAFSKARIRRWRATLRAQTSGRAELRFGRVSGLRLSFRNLVHVDNLQGLTSLRTLQLDNNALTSP